MKNMKDKILTRKLIKIRKDIKAKLNAIKSGRFQTEYQFENTLKPLKQLIEKASLPPQVDVKKEKKAIKHEKKSLIKHDDDVEKKNLLKELTISPIKKQQSGPQFIDEGNAWEFLSSTKADNTLQGTLPKTYFNDDSFREEPDLINPNENYMYMSNAYLDQFDELPRRYVEDYIQDTENKFDTHYLTHDIYTEKYRFGDSEMTFNGPDVVIKDKIYKGTPGLYEMLFKNIPIEKLITQEDRNNFKDIILSTNAHKRHFKKNEQVHGNRGDKYRHVIKPILEEMDKESKEAQKQYRTKKLTAPQTSQGKGLLMQYTNKPKEYVHWNDCNELVERLKLLISSQFSGNNSHVNEINSIIEELKEANIIE